MKKIINCLYMAVAVCAMTLGACSDDNDWQPGPAAEGEGLYFASDQQANITVTETSGTFTIDVYRSKAEGAITAQIATVTGDNATSLFTVPAEVSFAEGETKTALTVTYTGLERDVNYNLTLSVADSTPYGIAELGLTVICPLVWDVVSTNATLIDNLFEPFGAAGVELTGITVEKHPEQNRYRFRSPYDNEYFQGLFEMDVFEDDFEFPNIELDGETYPGGYFIAATKLGWRMVNGEGPVADPDWVTFGSVYGNWSTSTSYLLGSYDAENGVFDLGSLVFNFDNGGEEYPYPLSSQTLLYLNN